MNKDLEKHLEKTLKEKYFKDRSKRILTGEIQLLEYTCQLMYKDIIDILFVLGTEIQYCFVVLEEIFHSNSLRRNFKSFEIRTEIKIPDNIKLAIQNCLDNNEFEKALSFLYEFLVWHYEMYLRTHRI